MTPEERSDKIDKKIYSHTFADGPERVAWITEQIKEAEEEAYALGYDMIHTDRGGIYKTGLRAGQEKMREEAAKVAETSLSRPRQIANEIRTLDIK